MAVLSLRIVIGSLAAVSVAVIATVTLSITITTALAALRSVGTVHATSLVTNANVQTGMLFNNATDALSTLVNAASGQRWPYPSDDYATYVAFDTLIRSLMLPHVSIWTSIETYFADNTRHLYSRYDTPNGTAILQSNLLFTSYTLNNHSQSIVIADQELIMMANGYRMVPHTDPLYLTLGPQGAWSKVRDNGFWDNGLLPSTLNGQTPLFDGFFSSTSSSNVTSTYAIITAPLYRAGDLRVARNVYAVSVVAIEFAIISQFLAGVGGTPNTVAIAYDGNGFMIGSSLPLPYITKTLQTSTTVPDGCSSTSTDPGSYGATLLVCRAHIGSYAYAPLRSLATDSNDLLFPAVTREAAVWRAIGSDNYFVAASKVIVNFPGFTAYIVLILPEADIIGDVLSGRDAAIGVTCALFVVIAALNMVLVSMLLRPLTVIACRMIDAANLEDDESPDEPSAMSEVRALQAAYYEMNTELIRIRSFVPQTVLAARRADRNGDAVDEAPSQTETDPTTAKADKQSRRSNASSASSKKRKASDVVTDSRALYLHQTVVTVLAGNLAGLHHYLSTTTSTFTVAEHLAEVVQAVTTCVSTHHGVFTFHGDRFLATFNAASSCGGHARKAVEAGLQLKETLPSVGPKLPVRVGIATGSCLVGSIGSDKVKTFSTMGCAFTQATQLEVHGRRLGCWLLATNRTVVDVSLFYDYRYVTVAEMAGRAGVLRKVLVAELFPKPPPSVASNTANNNPTFAPGSTLTAVGGDHEWIYVVAGETANGGRFAMRNAIFDLIANNKLAEAREAAERLRAQGIWNQTEVDDLSSLLQPS